MRERCGARFGRATPLAMAALVTAACSPTTAPQGALAEGTVYDAMKPLPAVAAYARELYISECMGAQGYEYAVRGTFPPADQVLNLLGVRAMGSEDGTLGYVDLRVPQPEAPHTSTGAGYQDALYGANEASVVWKSGEIELGLFSSGCEGRANTAVYGELESASKFLGLGNEFLFTVSGRLESSEAIAIMLEDYAACMEVAGYQFSSPDEAFEYAAVTFVVSPAGGDVSDLEVRQATADARCQGEVGYLDTVNAAAINVASAWIDQHQEDLRMAAQWQEETLARAQNLVDESVD